MQYCSSNSDLIDWQHIYLMYQTSSYFAPELFRFFFLITAFIIVITFSISDFGLADISQLTIHFPISMFPCLMKFCPCFRTFPKKRSEFRGDPR